MEMILRVNENGFQFYSQCMEKNINSCIHSIVKANKVNKVNKVILSKLQKVNKQIFEIQKSVQYNFAHFNSFYYNISKQQAKFAFNNSNKSETITQSPKVIQQTNSQQISSNQMKVQNPQYQTIIKEHIKIDKHVKAEFTQFLQTFQEKGEKKYLKKAEQMITNDRHILVITGRDLNKHNGQLAEFIFNSYSRYQLILNRALTQFMFQLQNNFELNGDFNKGDKQVKQDQIQLYQVAFDRAADGDQTKESVRNLKCEMLGKLKSIVGTVTRVSQVRPELVQGVFKCSHCGRMSQKVVQQYKYSTPKKCLGQNCTNNSIWQLINKQSIFADFQKLRLQQDSSKIPPGSMPRSIDVILRNQNIEKGQPGDQVHVVGYLSVLPQIQYLLKPGQHTSSTTLNPFVRTNKSPQQQGIKGITGVKQLNYKLCFIGINVFVMNNQFNQQILTQQQAQEIQAGLENGYNQEEVIVNLMSKFNQTERLEIKRIQENPRVYDHLAESLFHEIFGHMEIKKSLLLQLLGGIHKKTETKISIRGDINILIVGDPSTAKSQFLKCVNKFVPRSVYTNGKTTTAAGLTASVVRDDSGNVSIQAGALLLADNGICCIDEFDKMQLKDQVAIHEAMQQQTISIAKAGIQATLHARTSILAAANPIFGRYQKDQSLRKNINISPPIMSRFDLYFIICDEANQQSDQNLSEFIVSMHQQKKQIKLQKPYTIKQVRNYLSVAKKLKPRLTQQSAKDLRRFYVDLRKRDKQQQNSQYQVTVRQLESMIRLSEALAKLHLDPQVKPKYVRQAYRLLSCSIVKLEKSVVELIDEPNMTGNQKQSFGLLDLINQNRIQKKDNKTFSISHQTFELIKNEILTLFEQKQLRHRANKIQDPQLYLTQQDVIAFLTCQNFQNGDLTTIAENKKVEKLYHGIVNVMIKEKNLLVLQQSKQAHQRRLCVHPNLERINLINR